MKRFYQSVSAGALLLYGSISFATSIDVITDQSAKFWLNSARYASTEGSADVAYYNPAGTAFMQKGLYFDLSTQTLIVPYDQKVSTAGFSDSYSQDTPVLSIPNFYLVDNLGKQGIGNFALFCNAGVIGGGGSLEWDGTAGTAATGVTLASNLSTTLSKSDIDFNASAGMYQVGAGAAYSFNDMVSLSAGARYVIARKEIGMEGRYSFANGATLDLDYETELSAEGYCFIFGVDVKPISDLNIGVKYETETALRYEYDHKKNSATDSIGDALASAVRTQNGLADRTKTDANFPAIFTVGAEYNVTNDLLVSASSVFYFMSKADMDGVEDYYGTGYDFSLGTTYKAMEDLKIGCSVNYTVTGAKESYYEADTQIVTASANPPLDFVFISGGATYNVTPAIDVTGSLAWIHYLPEDVTTAAGFNVKYEKEAYVIALEAGYKI